VLRKSGNQERRFQSDFFFGEPTFHSEPRSDQKVTKREALSHMVENHVNVRFWL
jgi:hypothetical protein